MRAFRAHHSLCTCLYEGYGYSDDFCKNMSKIITEIKEEKTQLEIVAQADCICKGCPHAKEGGKCMIDDSRIRKKDRRVCEILRLEIGHVYDYEQIQDHIVKYLNEKDFMNVCGSCEWHQKGICSYQKLMKRLKP